MPTSSPGYASCVPSMSDTQRSIFDELDDKRSHHTHDHDTSVAAATSNKVVRNKQHTQVLRQLKLAGPHGMTDYEIHKYTGILRGTVAKRRGELETRGWVEFANCKRVTDNNVMAKVWRITPEGMNQ